MTGTCLIAGNVPYMVQGTAPIVCGEEISFLSGPLQINADVPSPIPKNYSYPIPEGNFVNFPADNTVECNAILPLDRR